MGGVYTVVGLRSVSTPRICPLNPGVLLFFLVLRSQTKTIPLIVKGPVLKRSSTETPLSVNDKYGSLVSRKRTNKLGPWRCIWGDEDGKP